MNALLYLSGRTRSFSQNTVSCADHGSIVQVVSYGTNPVHSELLFSDHIRMELHGCYR